MLEELDLVPENLSVDALLSLHSLSSLAVALELKDTNTASYAQALCSFRGKLIMSPGTSPPFRIFARGSGTSMKHWSVSECSQKNIWRRQRSS